MTLWVSGALGLGVLLALVLWMNRESQRQKDELQREMDDAEAQRREWDIEDGVRNAVDHIDSSSAAILSDPHNRDRKKPIV